MLKLINFLIFFTRFLVRSQDTFSDTAIQLQPIFAFGHKYPIALQFVTSFFTFSLFINTRFRAFLLKQL